MGLVVAPTDDGNVLADNLLASNGSITINSVTYSGGASASGTFNCGTGIVGFEDGIVLTTGNAPFVIGPNDSGGAGVNNGTPGTDLIDTSFNATTLTINFIPQGNTVQFQYVFGSEEYNFYVNSGFNDAFRFLINGQNYALLPNGAGVVEINNVNNGQDPNDGVATGPCQNCEYFIDNNPVGAAPLNTQLDGLTTVLTFTAPVVAGQVNTLVMVIADRGDAALDSAVFIKADSFTVPPPPGNDGDVHKMTFNGPHDVHIVGCFRDSQAAGLPSHDLAAAYVARSSFRLEREDAEWANNTTVGKRVAFTFPDTTDSYDVPNPHTIIVDRDGAPVKVRAPLDPSSRAVVEGNLDEGNATVRFYANGTEQLLGTIVVAPLNGGYEVSAAYATGTEIRALVQPDVVVNTQLIPAWNANLVGMHGSHPMRQNLLSPDGLTAYPITLVQTDAAAVTEYANLWSCIPGASLFDTGVDLPPAPTGEQTSIVTAELTPEAAQMCTAAGVAAGRLNNCAFDVVVSGEELGPVMSDGAGSWSTLQDRPAPGPGPDICTIGTIDFKAANRASTRNRLTGSIDPTDPNRLIDPKDPTDPNRTIITPIICRGLIEFVAFKETNVNSQLRFELNKATIGKGANRIELNRTPFRQKRSNRT